MFPPIIGLLGRSRSGKDTVAGIIKELSNPIAGSDNGYITVRLSSPIKAAARSLFHFKDDQIEGNSKDIEDPYWKVTPRTVFQALTEDTMRYMGKDFFTRRLYKLYEEGSFGTHIIIPDIRYVHDIEEIRQRGGIVLKIERARSSHCQHACEDHIDAIDDIPIIHNDGSLEDLRMVVSTFVRSCRSRSSQTE